MGNPFLLAFLIFGLALSLYDCSDIGACEKTSPSSSD